MIREMSLLELCEEAGAVVADASAQAASGQTAISGISQHSQEIAQGDIFCCIKGSLHDGHDYALEAVKQGAVALLCERPLDLPSDLGVPEAITDNVRGAMARMAAALHGHPSRKTDVIGITGTNGKTTVAAMLAEILKQSNRSVRTLGTLAGNLTTLDSAALQAELHEAAEAGESVVMEASSHGLAQQRIEAVRFKACVFTNLSQDHLDYHSDMEDYFCAKQSLFSPERTNRAVVNIDTSYGRRLAQEMDSAINLKTCSASDAELLEVSLTQTRFAWEGSELSLQQRGSLAVENAVTAATTARELGVSLSDIKAGLAEAPQVPGRFEVVRHSPVAVVVDFAHTPEALARALQVCAETVSDSESESEIIAVFGCGGDRDKAKRPLMGEAASKFASQIILTSDNPRSESPEEIAAQIAAGITSTPFCVELDRRSAVRQALQEAKPGDIVLIAGKGHERTQLIGEQVLPFDDRVAACEESRNLWGESISTDQAERQSQ